MTLPYLTLDREQSTPIYLQLCERYLHAIATGKLRPGDRIPSVRSLASELNLARGTVELAYQMLTSEGYFVGRGPGGTIVTPGLRIPTERAQAPRSRPEAPTHPPLQTAMGGSWPLQLGLPALDAFPRKTWTRLTNRRARTLDLPGLCYPEPNGYEPLRQAIATYLGIARGIDCTPEQVFVTVGYRGALELICRALLKTDDVGWYEDPGYPFARDLLQSAGMRLAPVPVDAEGLVVSSGQARAPKARFAVVTPAHQSPMGVALSLPRRLELLDWASRRKAWIIEDDYDSEFRYHGRPLPSLKSMDRDGRVLYAGTFSKVLFPGLRLGYLVAPMAQIDQFREAARHLPGPGSILLQGAVFDFMEQGHFARHLRKMRPLYNARRGYLVDALEATFGSYLTVQPQAGGVRMLTILNTRQNDKLLAGAVRASGLAVQALGHWHMRRSAHDGLLMGFTNVTDPEMAMALAIRLKSAIDLA